MKMLRCESSNHLLRCGALALAVTLALGGTHVAAQALPAENAAASIPAETESVTTHATGSGTTNYLARWTSSTALGNSIIKQLDGKIGINNPNPASKLTVNGADAKAATIRSVNTAAGAGIAGSSAKGSGVTGVSGAGAAGAAAGVSGESLAEKGNGVQGTARAKGGLGVYGYGTRYGVAGSGLGAGVYGVGVTPDSKGVEGEANAVGSVGVYGHTSPDTTGTGVVGKGNGPGEAGVYGESDNRGISGHGTGDDGIGVFGDSTGGLAGLFQGNVVVTGTLTASFVSKSGGSFEIDHPLDPAHKLLAHSFVESPDMMNIYNGNAELNDQGEATVEMPDYFTALNQDYRYQLTAIGAPGPNLYVAEEIKENRFRIAGGKPGSRVSWMVTGVRQDAYANANRIAVEKNKSAAQVGRYLNPELFGQPADRAIHMAEHPAPGKIAEAVAAR